MLLPELNAHHSHEPSHPGQSGIAAGFRVGRPAAYAIREAFVSEAAEIIALYMKSQAATGIPDPRHVSPDRLAQRLYGRKATQRFVVVSDNRIIGHALIAEPNPDHVATWLDSTHAASDARHLLELGAAFVDPTAARNGIWSVLLAYRLQLIRAAGCVPVSVTQSHNHHVQRKFESCGGRLVGERRYGAMTSYIYIFDGPNAS